VVTTMQTEAFRRACHGGQQPAAEFLLERGADIDWIGYDDLTPLDTARRSNADQLAAWIATRGGRSAAEISDR
jgi:ankyrin repeat protein